MKDLIILITVISGSLLAVCTILLCIGSGVASKRYEEYADIVDD